MSKAIDEARKEIEALIGKIKYHNKLYYSDGRSEISDERYDDLIRRLKKLEKENPELIHPDSPTLTVGAPVRDGLLKAEHTAVMLSLDSANDELGVRRFADSCSQKVRESLSFTCEPKLDGLSIELVYENGRFLRGVTRGDGKVGEDVTLNLMTIPSVPKELKGNNIPEKLSVRGEVIMHIPDFHELNKKRLASGKNVFANPRNVAAGSLRQLDQSVTAGRKLNVYCYQILDSSDPFPGSQFESLEFIDRLGFVVSPYTELCESIEEAIAYHHRMESERDHLDFEIDGVVIKLDGFDHQKILGTRSNNPRWALAYKFEPRKGQTQVQDIVVQVGRTGVLTPLALLKPVDVGGVTVSRATLHNMDQIGKLDLRIGDYVRVERAGDVIPKISEVLHGKRNGDQKKFSMPDNCPSCGSAIKKEDVYYRCMSSWGCPAQVKEGIKHFASKGAADIEGLSDRTVELLYDRGLIENISDIYGLTAEKLLDLPGWREKKAVKLVRAIEESKNISLSRFISGLGIRNVGRHIADLLAEEFGSLERLSQAQKEELVQLDEIGPGVAGSIVSFFDKNKNIEEIRKMTEAGLKVLEGEKKGKLAGKKFLFTGTLQHFSRTEAQKEVEKKGGQIASGISSKVDFLVAGKKPGSKLKKAEKTGIRILNEEEFKSIVRE